MGRFEVIDNLPRCGKKEEHRKRTVVKMLAEYSHFYLFQGRFYKFCINKNDLICKHFLMKEVGGQR